MVPHRRAKATYLVGCETLFAEYDRLELNEGARDFGENLVGQCGEIDPQYLGTKRPRNWAHLE